MRIGYTMVFVSDMGRSIKFYRDVLGLPLKFESPGWTEFATDAAGGPTLALHKAEAPAGAPDDPDRVPPGRARIGFRVDNLDSFHARMEVAGVRCIQPPKPTFGVRIAQYVDPDGLGFSVGEASKKP